MRFQAGLRQHRFALSRPGAACAARPRLRPVVWALFWASLAHLSWTAFRLGQIRLQPDAIATGVPGFLFRLVILPFHWVMANLVPGNPSVPALSAPVIMTICCLLLIAPWLRRRSGAQASTFAGFRPWRGLLRAREDQICN